MAGAKKVLLTMTLLILGSNVIAMPQFRLTAIQQLGYDKLDPPWQYSGKVMGCTFCHVNKGGRALERLRAGAPEGLRGQPERQLRERAVHGAQGQWRPGR